MTTESRFCVYVVLLDNAVLDERRFVRENPQHLEGRPCVYVGMTGLTPIERFKNHKRGHKANAYVNKYGIKLITGMFSRLNPLSYTRASQAEVRLATELRRRGYAVWQR